MPVTTLSAAELEALAKRFQTAFPHLAPGASRVGVLLYRLLSRGQPVSWRTLAGTAGLEETEVRALVAGWPGVYEDAHGLTGFGGLSIRAVSAHRMVVHAVTLFTRCAYDTLFLPPLLGAPAQVSSACAATGTPVHLSVSADGVQRLAPAGTLLSLLPPDASMAEDLTQHF